MSREQWNELWDALNQTARLLSQDEPVDPQALEARTLQLAKPLDRESTQEVSRALVFALGNERYAWAAESVRAIARVGRLTPVPSTPSYYSGVVSLRGQVLSVMDLRIFLGMPPLDSPGEFMIVVAGAGLEIAVLATEVFDVIDLPMDSLAPASGAGLDMDLVIGVTGDGLTLLDAEALLKRERLRVESEI